MSVLSIFLILYDFIILYHHIHINTLYASETHLATSNHTVAFSRVYFGKYLKLHWQVYLAYRFIYFKLYSISVEAHYQICGIQQLWSSLIDRISPYESIRVIFISIILLWSVPSFNCKWRANWLLECVCNVGIQDKKSGSNVVNTFEEVSPKHLNEL